MELSNVFDDVVVICNGMPKNSDLERFNTCPAVYPTDDEIMQYSNKNAFGWHFDRDAKKMVGIRLAHAGALNLALNEGYNNILVLEDDCCFIEGYQDNLGVVKDFLSGNDWALFFLGGRHYVNKDSYNTLGFPGIYQERITPNIVKTMAMIGTHAVAYNMIYYHDIMSYIIRDDLMPLDHCYSGLPMGINRTLLKDLPSYAIDPLITWQIDNRDKPFWLTPLKI